MTSLLDKAENAVSRVPFQRDNVFTARTEAMQSVTLQSVSLRLIDTGDSEDSTRKGQD